MTDGITLANSQSPGVARRASGYQAEAVREVQNRAAVTNQSQSADERNGLRRLNQSLDRPLREDVPRGYYLNIRV
ncbi:MAG: hypothetical protein HOB37_14815 [Rhodospirillaceae bacterium]|jgi:hypothetical protein|nr:hypothetical protein [Rhodospirillaceae bacterium]MBT3908574.1 hypothetical protein [Rhodospirillaceae bacterium]MBT5296801.1 hypothetical protein [Rhodospirillaceae bacterium]MBT5516130.1 hypothetical protein [Rhodospirillaceae bacterium]MBT6086406.1 hypothetical protein [Rhodospirillaceae bacterium]